MNEQHHIDWQVKSWRFQMLWLLLLGGIIVLWYAFGVGKEITSQTATQLGKFGSQSLTLQLVRIGITREVMPVNIGLTLALLSPILGTYANFMVKKSNLTNKEQEKVLISTRLKSLSIAAPVLLVIGIIFALLVAYLSTDQKYFNDLFNAKDFIESLARVFLFTCALSILGFIEVKLFFKESRVARRVAICVTAIFTNFATILVIDLILGQLLSS